MCTCDWALRLRWNLNVKLILIGFLISLCLVIFLAKFAQAPFLFELCSIIDVRWRPIFSLFLQEQNYICSGNKLQKWSDSNVKNWKNSFHNILRWQVEPMTLRWLQVASRRKTEKSGGGSSGSWLPFRGGRSWTLPTCILNNLLLCEYCGHS